VLGDLDVRKDDVIVEGRGERGDVDLLDGKEADFGEVEYLGEEVRSLLGGLLKITLSLEDTRTSEFLSSSKGIARGVGDLFRVLVERVGEDTPNQA